MALLSHVLDDTVDSGREKHHRSVHGTVMGASASIHTRSVRWITFPVKFYGLVKPCCDIV
jgi:hypothetical protein